MKKQVLYKYLGTNGVIESPVHLEDIYYVRINVLNAEKGKILTNGKDFKKMVRCSDEELSQWEEVADKGQS
ncbi:MAG: hypothetical protein J6W64_10350 [Bacilli bacterium]|nr:hypothetical protein [Bacilli bacterium]MBO7536139.1 hypothetical protein [Bacilli bacterium]